jgi:hypothetical protein
MPRKPALTIIPSSTKAAFIRSLPLDMPTAKVIAQGKKIGHVLTGLYIYKVRAEMKAGKRFDTGARLPTVETIESVVSVSPAVIEAARSQKTEAVLRAAASLLGIDNAIAILEEQRASVRALLRKGMD